MRRWRDERGSGLVELALVAPLLFMLVFGMISYGLVLAFKQTTEESASEGARAALVDYVNNSDPVAARVAGRTAAAASMSSWEPTCDTDDADGDGLGCWAYTHDCTYPISGVLDPAIPEATYNTGATPDCTTIVVFHDYDGHPFLPQIPLIDELLPDSITSAATVQITD